MVVDMLDADTDFMAFDESSPQDMQLVHGLAEQVYAMWKQNSYHQVQFIAPQEPAPACVKQPDLFDTAVSLRPSQHEETFRQNAIVAGKHLCAVCPLQMQCLANSLTQPQYSQDGEYQLNGHVWDELLYGGYGPGARGLIFDALVGIWGADPTAPSDPGIEAS